MLNPLEVSKIKVDKQGRRSKEYIGEFATTVVNPDTSEIITGHATHTKIVAKLKKKLEEGGGSNDS